MREGEGGGAEIGVGLGTLHPMSALPATPPRLPGARLSLTLLILINLINYIDRYILAAVEPNIRAEFLKNDLNASTKSGLLATAFIVSYMCSAPVFGWLADKFNRWVIVGAGVLLWTLATGATALAPNYTLLLVSRALVGIGEGAWGPTAPTIIADMYPVKRRGFVLSWFYASIPVGSALGYVLGGQMAAHFTWHWAFWSVVPPGILLGVWSFFRADPPRGGNDAGSVTRSMRLGDVKLLFKTPSYVINTIGMTAMTFALGGMSFFLPGYVSEYRMHNGTDAAGNAQLGKVSLLIGAITVVCGLTGTIVGGVWGDKLRDTVRGAYFKVSGWSMLAAFPVFVAVLFTPFPVAWVLLALVMFLLFLNTGPTNTITANVTHPSLRATAFAVNILAIHALGDSLSPPLIGAVRDATNNSVPGTLLPSLAQPGGNMNLAFGLVGLAILVSGVLWLLGAKHLPKDTERAPTRLPEG